MRAARVVERGRIECVEAEPEQPRQGDLLVRTEYASICGSDLHVVFDGVFADPPLLVPGFPGHEGIGEVIETTGQGPVVGARVLCLPSGFAQPRCFAELQRVRASQVIVVDPAVAPLEALMAQQLGTVLFAARRHPPDVGGKVAVVLGQGSAGLFWAGELKRRGARLVIASDPLAHRRRLGPQFGADLAVGPDELAMVVGDHTGGAGADYVVEAVGNEQALASSIEVAAAGATVFWFGLPDRTTAISFDFAGFFRRKLTVHTTFGAQEEPGLASFHDALELVRSRAVDVGPLLTHTVGIEHVQHAFDLAMAATPPARCHCASDPAPTNSRPLQTAVSQRRPLPGPARHPPHTETQAPAGPCRGPASIDHEAA